MQVLLATLRVVLRDGSVAEFEIGVGSEGADDFASSLSCSRVSGTMTEVAPGVGGAFFLPFFPFLIGAFGPALA